MSHIDLPKFTNTLLDHTEFWSSPHDIDTASYFITDAIYKAALESRIKHTPTKYPAVSKNATQRWSNILNSNDSQKIWAAIDWKGNYKDTPDNLSSPTDEQFCEYFTNLLNDTPPERLLIPETDKVIPELDRDFEPGEIDDCIKDLKSDKAAGIDGIPPGLFKSLSDEWIVVLTYLFNMVFSGEYPLQWTIARLFMIFKKGDRLFPSNYRGISIVTAISKIYDMVLNNRFMKWFSPSFEQSGAQRGRSCSEQILVVRLLVDIARKLRLPLYIGFIDFQKAYDWLNRNLLLTMLADEGCSKRFLNAVAASLSTTLSRIGNSEFASTKGVRQGGPSSCALFTYYVDCMIKSINEYGPDGWLGVLHCLMQMDDTAVFATSRESFIDKLKRSKQCSDKIKQSMHPVKSKFFTVNMDDKEPIYLDNVKISYQELYIYLDTELSNSNITEQVRDHLASKNGNKLKFLSFLAKNSSAPYKVKEKV